MCDASHPETIHDLKHAIKVTIAAIERHTIENVRKKWIDSMSYCKVSQIWYSTNIYAENHKNRKTISYRKKSKIILCMCFRTAFYKIAYVYRHIYMYMFICISAHKYLAYILKASERKEVRKFRANDI